MIFKGRRSLAKLAAGEGAGKGAAAAAGTVVGSCSQICANSSLAFLSGQGEVEKHFFFS